MRIPTGGVLLGVMFILLTVSPGAATADQEEERQLAAQQLQGRLMAFADTLMNTLFEEYTRLEEAGLTPEQRLALHTRLTLYSTAAVTIASGPDVAQNLLDMLAMVTLSRVIVDEPAFAKEMGIDVRNLRAIGKEFERRIWDIAADVATAEELAPIKRFIDDYRRRNPDQRHAYFVRFDEAAVHRGKSKLTRAIAGGGLLSSVSAAGQAVDQVRETAERALFISNRMPILASWQVENLFYRLAVSPEFRKLSNSPDELKTSVDALSASIEAVPGLVTRERKAIFKALDGKDGALEGTLGELRTTLNDAVAALPKVEAVAASAERTLESGQRTTAALEGVLSTSERLLDKIQADADKLDRVLDAIPRIGDAAERLDGALGSVERIIGEGRGVDSLIDHMFWRAAQLIVIFFIALLVYRVARERWAPPPGTG